jgi:CheY-like chemotaxis protein
MARALLIHWNVTQGAERAAILRERGHDVAHRASFEPDMLRRLSDDPPDAVVIDLTRTPSHGRDVALALRERKGTRGVPLVFAGGDPVKVARIRELMPDTTFTDWSEIDDALRGAIEHPPLEPVVPHRLAGYSGTPLWKKLGIKPGCTVSLIGAPDAVDLGDLPPGVVVVRRVRGAALTLWFVRSRAELEAGVSAMVPRSEGGGLWIVWPKKASRVVSDLTQQAVRDAGLAAGMVDFKVCSIDETWSGLRFSRREA